MRIIDTHAHYDHARFDTKNNHRELHFHAFPEAGICSMINAAIGFDSNDRMKQLYEQYPWAYYAVGVHPNAVGEYNETIYREWKKELYQMADAPGVVAIGETGLDFHRDAKEKVMQSQEYWFHTLLKLAKEKELPIIFHIRDAHKEAIALMKQYTFEQSGVIHCFNRDWKEAKTYLDMNLYLGIGGSITYPEHDQLREAIKQIPMEKILLETDAPFVKPAGYTQTGSNSSLSLPLIIQAIAELKQMTCEEVAKKTTENAARLFHLKLECAKQ